MVAGYFRDRFNVLREEGGHVFQSRYKSLVVEEGRPLLGLVNYIHLNPVRAGLVTVGKLRTYQASSYPKFFESRPPEPLRRGRFLSALEFSDSVAGMRQYERQLEFAEESDPASRDALAKAVLSRLGGGLRGVSSKSQEALCGTRGTQRLGRAGSSRIERREMGEGARGPTKKNWQDRKGSAGGPQKRQMEGTHSPGTASSHDGHKRMDR